MIAGLLPEKLIEEAEKIFSKSIDDSKFIQGEGAKEAVKSYTRDLVKRSFEIDGKEHVARGTHMRQYMHEAAAIVEDPKYGLNIDAMQKGDLGAFVAIGSAKNADGSKKLDEIKDRFHKAAHDNIGLDIPVPDDFKAYIHRLSDKGKNITQNPAAATQDDPDAQEYKKLKDKDFDTKQEMSNPLLMILMMFVAVLTGQDPKEAMAMFQKDDKQPVGKGEHQIIPHEHKLHHNAYDAAENLVKGDPKEAATYIKAIGEDLGITIDPQKSKTPRSLAQKS